MTDAETIADLTAKLATLEALVGALLGTLNKYIDGDVSVADMEEAADALAKLLQWRQGGGK